MCNRLINYTWFQKNLFLINGLMVRMCTLVKSVYYEECVICVFLDISKVFDKKTIIFVMQIK